MNLARINVAKKTREIETLGDLFNQYDEFIFTYEQWQSRQWEVAAIRYIMEEREVQLERGLISRRQVVEARSEPTKSMDKLMMAEQDLNRQRNALLRLIADELSTNRVVLFVPVGRLSYQVPPVDDAEIFASALQYRPDYLQAIHAAERNDIELQYAKNQTLPQLDVIVTMGLNGLEGSIEDSFDRLFDTDAPEVTAGVVFSRPWSNREAKARLREARKKKTASIYEIKKIEHNALLDV